MKQKEDRNLPFNTYYSTKGELLDLFYKAPIVYYRGEVTLIGSLPKVKILLLMVARYNFLTDDQA